MRCLYLDADGRQCPCRALAGWEFCHDHLPLPDGEDSSEITAAYRAARRLGAALLLGMFLLQVFIGIRSLYGW